jgi:hypothetical protein
VSTAKTEVNVLVLGDPTAGFCDVSHAIAAQSDADELKARLVDRYVEFVRSQNSFHVRRILIFFIRIIIQKFSKNLIDF